MNALGQAGQGTERLILDLLRGIKFECTEFSQQVSNFPDKNGVFPKLVRAYIRYSGVPNVRCFTVLPGVINDLRPEAVNHMIVSIQLGQPPSVVYYGKCGADKHVEALTYGEDVDMDKLFQYAGQ